MHEYDSINRLRGLKVIASIAVLIAVVFGISLIVERHSSTITYTCEPGEVLVVSLNPDYPQEDRYLYACVTGGPAHKVVTER